MSHLRPHISRPADLLVLGESSLASNLTAVQAYLANIVTGIASFAGQLVARGYTTVLISTIPPPQVCVWPIKPLPFTNSASGAKTIPRLVQLLLLPYLLPLSQCLRCYKEMHRPWRGLRCSPHPCPPTPPSCRPPYVSQQANAQAVTKTEVQFPFRPSLPSAGVPDAAGRGTSRGAG